MTTDTITLPNGDTITKGQGGSYTIGSDIYPVTIVGWSPSGRTIYYRRAHAHATGASDYYGEQAYLFTDNAEAPTQAATWRRAASAFRPKGDKCGTVKTDGYDAYTDSAF